MTVAPRLLLVDDEPEVLAALRVGLRRYGFEIMTAISGEEALQLVDDHGFDVVVSDEQMPGMSGSSLLAAIRLRSPSTVRIVLTGQASLDATMAAINEASVFRFLTKPCSAAELAGCIESGLAHRTVDPEHERVADTVTFSDATSQAEVWYQPLFDASGDAAAHEALIRPNHPALAGPDQLIGAARTIEQKFELDRHVRSAIRADVAAGRVDTEIFVNLLPESLEDPMLLSDGDPLAEIAERVVLEVTERVSLDAVADVLPTLDLLRERGFAIALDDLGGGYAGLTSFVTMRPDVVKFDLDMVRDINEIPAAERVMESLVGVCRDLGIRTVAEGIESPDELSTLQRIGVDLFQGYLLAKPAPLW